MDAVRCVECCCSFHPSCAGQAKVSDKSGKVNCCATSKSEVDSTQKIRKISENLEVPLEMDEKKMKCIIDQSLKQMFKPLENKLEKKFEDLEKSMNFISTCFEEQKAQVQEALQEVRELRRENNTLKLKVQQLEVKMDNIESKEKANNMVIVGVPKQANMNEKQITHKILNSMNVQIHEDDMLEGFRLTKQEDGPILVKFKNVHVKSEALRRIKQLKGTTVNRCGLEGRDRKIYLNDDLTIRKRELFKLVRDTKHKKGYKAAFCSNGIIYLKKSEQDPPIRIQSEADL